MRGTGAADVQQAVNFARTHRLSLSLRGGGHSAPGYGTIDGGLMVDLSPMKGMQVDWGPPNGTRRARRTLARAGSRDAGVRPRHDWRHHLNDRRRRSDARRRARLAHRQLGLTVDNLISADVVTADGELRNASATTMRICFGRSAAAAATLASSRPSNTGCTR